MKTKNISLTLAAATMLLTLPACNWFTKSDTRETIFDKVVSIPKELVLDIPYLPPLCDELPGLIKGYAAIKDGRLYYEEEGQGIPLIMTP
jgi:hypothetical protein